MVVPVLLLIFLRTTSAADPGRLRCPLPPILLLWGSKLRCSMWDYRGRALACPWNRLVLGFYLGPNFQQSKRVPRCLCSKVMCSHLWRCVILPEGFSVWLGNDGIYLALLLINDSAFVLSKVGWLREGFFLFFSN